MSYLDERPLGKRSQPSKANSYENDLTSAKKRDQKRTSNGAYDSSDTRETDMNQISAKGGEKSDGEFSKFPEFHPDTPKVLREKGITGLFPIQQHCFYPIWNREDLIARDLTGSGKTFAFGFPIIELLRKKQLLGTGKVQAIILAPTRELAIQITTELTKLKHSPEEFKIVTVYGGVSVMDQANQLKRGVDFFVGTTGRVMDHMERGNIDFSGLKTVVLDEADVMLKLGFKEDIEKILGKVREVCEKDQLQIVLFSATMPGWVKDIAREHMKPNFKMVDLAQDLKNKTARNVKHLAIECPWHNRLEALAKVLDCYAGNGRTVVFSSTKADCNSLLLSDKIIHDCEVMHGDIAQNQREVTIKRFKEAKFQVLVATDVASRGLDIPNVELIIQLEPPKDTESYIHRSGRTARMGKSGTCITFYNNRNMEFLERIEQLAGIKFDKVGIPSEADMVQAKTKDVLKKLLDVEMDVLPNFKDTAKMFIKQNEGDSEKALQIALAYISGHYKQTMPTKSLLTGRDNMCTIKMNVEQGKELNQDSAMEIIKRYWAPRIADTIRTMQSMKDGSGVCFDIYSNQAEGFMDNFTHLKESSGRRVDFEVSRCKTLPDLEGGGNSGHQSSHNRGPQDGSGGGGYNGNGGGGRRNGGGGYGDRGGESGNRGGGNSGYGSKKRDEREYGNGGGNSGQGGGGGAGWSGSAGGGGGGAASGGWGGGGSGWTKDPSSYVTPMYKKQLLNDNPIEISEDSTDGGNTPHNGDDSRAGKIIYLTNLSYNTDEHSLMEFLIKQDYHPKRAKLLYDQQGRSKGTGFVQMDSSYEATKACKLLSSQNFEGRKLIVNMASNQTH